MPRGRKHIPIDWDEFDKLCMLQCGIASIALWFGCSEDTIRRAVKREKKCNFETYWGQKAEKGRGMLRQKQFEVAMRGNVAMLIFLGTNWLGQTDRVEAREDDTPLPWED